jgi:hypothetical protein
MHTLKFLSCFCAMLLMATFNIFADAIVDDCEGGTNQNKFGFYWYFFDDHKDGGNSSIPGVAPDGTGGYIVAPTAGAGHVGAGIALPYKLGPTMAGTPPSYNFIGMGTMLAANGKTLDLTGATSITFWLKSTNAISLDFQLVDTVHIPDFAYFYYTCTIPAGVWTKFVVPLSAGGLGGLAQYSWTKLPAVPFTVKTVSKLQWQISLTGVGTNTSGTVTIDDISIQGYNYVPPDLCTSCAGAAGQTPSPAALLSNFDAYPYSANARGYYWFCYADGVGRTAPASDWSVITGGATVNALDPTKWTLTLAAGGTKGYNSTNGADIQFTLGQTFTNPPSTDVVKPFVGIGTNLWNDQTLVNPYNADLDGMTGIYFDYMLSGADQSMVVRLEVYANNFQTPGEVFYIDLPYTGTGVWKGASVPWSKLVLPSWQGITPATFQSSNIEKIQWAVQSTKGDMGELAIDNIYLTGGNKITTPIRYQYNAVKGVSGVSASLISNNLRVSIPQNLSNVSLSLVNTQGSVVVKKLPGVNHTALMSVSGLAKGVYMLNVKAVKSGEAFNNSTPVTIY